MLQGSIKLSWQVSKSLGLRAYERNTVSLSYPNLASVLVMAQLTDELMQRIAELQTKF